ncbi:MAG: hypothetical protein WCG25_09710 [bacterium]
MKKNVVIFYDSELYYIEEDINIVKEAGFEVEAFISADKLLERLKTKHDDVCLIVSELIVEGNGNNFNDRRKTYFENCALYLLDELDSLSKELPADNSIKDIPKIVFTSWSHAQNGELFDEIKSDPRIKMALIKIDTTLDQFRSTIKKIIG